MAGKMRVKCAGITNKIYCGIGNEKMFVGKKHDVTDDAISATAQSLLGSNTELQFEIDGKKYALRVVEL